MTMKLDLSRLDVRQMPLSVTEAAFCAWIAAAVPGDALAYHHGFLALERDDAALGKPECLRLRRLADRALWAAQVGLVHLVQQRLAPGRFVYLAIARPKKPGTSCRLRLDLHDAE